MLLSTILIYRSKCTECTVGILTPYTFKPLRHKALRGDVRNVRCFNTHYIYSTYKKSEKSKRARAYEIKNLPYIPYIPYIWCLKPL